MTFARSRAKKTWKNSRTVAAAFVAAALVSLSFPFNSHASGGNVKIFQRQATLCGRIPAAVLVVGWENDGKDVEKMMDIVVQKANESCSRLDASNPSSEVSKLNASAGQGQAVPVSEDVVEAFKSAQLISKWTDGAFDIAAAGSGSWKDISISGSSVQLKSAGMQVRFDSMLEGFLAELMVRYINAATMQNAMVKVGTTFRGIGQGLAGPWKIQVQDDEGTYAHHALNLTVSNTAIATISANQFRAQPLIDPRSKQQIAPPCRGVTLVMNEASQAQGVANAVFLLGPDEGMKLLAKLGKAKALVVDNNGKFIRTPGF